MQNHTDIETLNEFQLNNLFNNSLINNLPYLFWMYELMDGKYRLIKWNKNQEIYTEYSAEELYHKNALDFFDKKGKDRVAKAIADVFKKGKSNIFENLLTKSGKLIPYFFEGYIFNFSKRQIFIGLSVDVSKQKEIKEKLLSSEKERERLLAIEKEDKKELQAYTSKIIQDNIAINKISKQVDYLLSYESLGPVKSEIVKLKKIIQSQEVSNYNWEIFQPKIDKVYDRFFEELKLVHPNLTKSEIQFCALIKVKLPLSDISSILKISKEGIKKKKYRIRKKFNLKRNESLAVYLKNF